MLPKKYASAIITEQLKTCSRCNFSRPLRSFSKNQFYCKTCSAIYFNGWKRKNRKKYKEYFIAYAAANGCKPRLNDGQRQEIVNKYYLEDIGPKKLARDYNVSLTTIYRILKKSLPSPTPNQ